MPAKIAARRCMALPLLLLGALIPATSAHAALNLANPVAAPVNTDAGAHSVLAAAAHFPVARRLRAARPHRAAAGACPAPGAG